MIKLDIHKYDTICDEYFKKVYATINRNSKRTDYTPNVMKEPKVVRELVYAMYDFDLVPCLIDASNDPCNLLGKNTSLVDDLDDNQLETAVRALVLADVSRLSKAAEKLCTDNSGKFLTDLEKYKKLIRSTGGTKTAADIALEGQLKKKYGFLVKFADRAYENMRNQKVDLSETVSVKLPELMVGALGIRTCPYCNRSFIGLTRGQLLGVQLDHFYNRHKFPFFAISLFNLVPCCGVCNHVKRDVDSAMVSPFEQGVDFDKAIHFTYEIPKSSVPAGGKRQLSIEVRESDKKMKKRYTANIKTLRLEDAYHFQENEAGRFYEKMMAYPKSRLEEIARHYKKNAPGDIITAKELEEALFYEYFTEPGDYDQKPMAKFYRDLYYEIRGWK